MGFFDKLKKKAQDAMGGQQEAPSAPEPEEMDDAPAAAAPRRAGPPAEGTFTWDGDTYPLPAGWSGLSMEDWFLKLETLRDKVMRADELDLPRMQDEDGDDLDPEEVVLVQEGFDSGGHFEAFRNWGVFGWARQTGENPTDVEFRMTTMARERMTGQRAQQMQAPGGALSPIEGVSVEQWAKIQAGIAGGGDHNALLAQAGIDPAKWERVSAEWMSRMQTDTTHTVSQVYAAAFAGGGQFGAQAQHAAAVGVGGDLSNEPVPFERFVEIQEAMGAWADRGEDVNAMMQSHFGISAMDWSNIGMFWNKKMAQEATKYHALFTQYSDKYRAKYAR